MRRSVGCGVLTLMLGCQGPSPSSTKEAAPDSEPTRTEGAEAPPELEASQWTDEPDPAFAPGPGDRPIPGTEWERRGLIGKVARVEQNFKRPGGGEVVSITKFNAFGQVVEAQDSNEAQPWKTTKLDDEGRVVEETSTATGSITRYLAFDEADRVLHARKSIPHRPGRADIVAEDFSEYDANGHRVRHVEKSEFSEHVTTYSYDADGDVVAETKGGQVATRTIAFDGPRKRLQYVQFGEQREQIIDRKSGRVLSELIGDDVVTYEYIDIDDHGNWLVADRVQGGEPWRMTRKIEYFED